MSTSVRRLLFLGFAVPDGTFARVVATDKGLPAQTQRFGWSVIKALQSAEIEVIPVSAEPVTDYPNNSRLVVRGTSFDQDDVRGATISFLNVTGLKHLTRYIAARRVAQKCATRGPVDAVLVHGVHSPLLWVGLHFGAKVGCPVVAIITDAPSLQTRYDNRGTALMKRVDRSLILRALGRMDGVVVLSPQLASDFAPGVPSLWMEGVAPEIPLSHLELGEGPRTVVYAGGLHASYGVLDLVEAVTHSGGSWRLVVYGRGPVEQAVSRAAHDNSRVEYGGTVTAAQLVSVYGRADLLVNPRPPHAELARYSFPSKMLEYLASGTPVLTTRLPNLPKDYEPHLFFTDPGPEGLARAIDGLMDGDAVRLRAVGEGGREFIQSTRGTTAQGHRLAEFLDSCRNGATSPVAGSASE